MDLHFLGTGAAFYPELYNTNAWFAVDDRFFLVDCGETAFRKLRAMKELTACTEIFAAITHLHADHAGSLGTLISYCHYVLKKPITAIHPKENIVDFLRIAGVPSEFYRYERTMPPGAGALFEAVPVEHVPDIDCFGYKIRTDAWAVYFSGDAAQIPPAVLDELRAGKLDRVYQDTSSVSKPGHCPLDRLEEVVEPELRHKITCVHLDCDFRQRILSAGFRIADTAE